MGANTVKPWEEYQSKPWEQYQESSASKSGMPVHNPQKQYDELRFKQPPKLNAYQQTAQDDSAYTNLMAGIGGGATKLYEGSRQALGADNQAKINEDRLAMNALNETAGGFVGDMIGQTAAIAPLTMIPGANSVIGASLVSGSLGAMQPTLKGESRLLNTGIGLFGGAGGAKLGKLGAKYAGKYATNKNTRIAKEKLADSLKTQTIQEGRKAGYVLPPSYAKAGIGSRLLESTSGKYKTNQLAGIRNQKITNKLAKESIGWADDTPITKEGLQQIRTDAFEKGYKPVYDAGQIIPDKQYTKDLNKIVASRNSASKSFPDAIKDEVSGVVDALRVNKFDANHAIELTRLYRENATKAYRGGDDALGRVYRSASRALEDQIERSLANVDDMTGTLTNFRSARKLMAQTHTIEKALIEGTGDINATKIAGAFTKGTPLEGKQKTIGKFAQSFQDVTKVPKSGDANPVTILDIAYGLAGAGVDPTLLALPVARVGSRYGILSKPYQNAFVKPQYGNAAISESIAGLLGSDSSQAIAPILSSLGLLNLNEQYGN